MNRLRKFLFWIFAAGYAVVCPIAILFTLGHIKAGLITLEVSPAEAEVDLAGRRLKGPWPRTIARLPSGTYRAIVRADAYGEIVREVSVTRGEATVLDHLLLLPDPLAPDVVVRDKTFADMKAVPGTQSLLLEKAQTNRPTLLAYDWGKGEVHAVLPSDSEFAGSSVSRIDTAAGSTSAVVWFGTSKEHIGMVIEFGGDKIAARTTATLTSSQQLPLLWDDSVPDAFFAVDRNNGAVRRVFQGANEGTGGDDSEASAGLLVGASPWRGFGIGNGEIYGLDGDYQLRRMDAEGKLKGADEAEPKPEEIEKARLLFGEEGFFTIIPKSKETFFFHGEHGKLLQNELPHQLAGEASMVRGVRVTPDIDRALVWQAGKAGVIDEPAPARRGGDGQLVPGREVRWFYNEGTNITDAHLVYNGSHALILDGDRVLLFELFPGIAPREREVARVKSGTPIAYAEEIGTLFFLGQEQGRLNALQILPELKEPAPISAPKTPKNP